MNIYAKQGDKVRCDTFEAGYTTDRDQAEKLLELGKVYTVKYVTVHPYRTEVQLEEIPNCLFNSVFFEDYDDGTLKKEISVPDLIEGERLKYTDSDGNPEYDNIGDFVDSYYDTEDTKIVEILGSEVVYRVVKKVAGRYISFLTSNCFPPTVEELLCEELTYYVEPKEVRLIKYFPIKEQQ